MKDLKNKHIVVVGAGLSGLAAALLLHKKGGSVFVTDHDLISKMAKKKLNNQDIPFEEDGHTQQAFGADMLVLSPGVPSDAPLVQQYREAGKDIFSEIEVAYWFNKSPLVAVTGSNGKTTVTNWLDHTWTIAGRTHFSGGNIGSAFSENVERSADDSDGLLEISSFQLDHIDTFKPHISLILNITADHLDRYENNFTKYAAAKCRITENQSGDDWFIYNYDDSTVAKHAQMLKKKRMHPGCWHFLFSKNRTSNTARTSTIRTSF